MKKKKTKEVSLLDSILESQLPKPVKISQHVIDRAIILMEELKIELAQQRHLDLEKLKRIVY